jgi:hypothetical protein
LLRGADGYYRFANGVARGAGKPVELEVDDLGPADGLRLTSFSGGLLEVSVSKGKVVIPDPKEINIYWARAARKP